MADLTQIRHKANESLAERFRPDRVGEYAHVNVLLLRWQESDLPRLSEEEDLLAKLFREKFRFQVDQFGIPMEDGDLALEKRLLDLMAKLRANKPSLGIIHYGGHGDDDISTQGRREDDAVGVWASHYKDGSSLCWSDIQPRLGKADADILLLLDCCFAAQAARGGGMLVVPPNVEILAACPKGCKTPGPMTQQSFTLALIREMEAGLARPKTNDTLTVREIHQRLASKQAGLKETPVYFAKDRGTVRLRPLQAHAVTTATDRTQADLPAITLKIILRNSISDSLVDDVVMWLKQNAPPDIAQVSITELTNQTRELRDFISEENESRSSNTLINMDQLPTESQDQVKDAWSRFTGRLVHSLRHFGLQHYKDMNWFIRDFEANNNSLRRTVEREILTTPQLYEAEHLERGIQLPRSQILGLADAFRVRLTNMLPESSLNHPTLDMSTTQPGFSVLLHPTAPNSLSVEKHKQWETQVLVEWKQSEDLDSAKQDIKRLNRLAEALKAASAGHFRTLVCLGHVVLPAAASAKYGLVFQRPGGGCEQVTLYTLLREQQSQARRTITIPTLGERIRLAFEIAQALMRWHLAGWLHQGIASFHIVFFKTSPTTVDYSKPYLVGFNYTRENDSSSATRAGDPTMAEKIRDLYRHPERQGSRPPKKHLRKHDLYALGLLLIEIGRWISLGDVFHSVVSNTLGDLSSVPEAARKLTERVLAFNMGAAYRDATAASLQGHLGVVEDDEHGTKFIAAFESQIVRKLEAGLKIDE